MRVTWPGSVEVSDVTDFLGSEENSNFIGVEIESMAGKAASVVIVEVVSHAIDKMERFYTFSKHLLLDFIEDLVGFVAPVHAVTDYNQLPDSLNINGKGSIDQSVRVQLKPKGRR